MPISAYSTLLPHVTRYTPSTPAPPAATFHSVGYPSSYTVPPVIVKSSPPPEPLIPAGPAPQLDAKLLNPLELYDSPQTTFPTPSELLTELAQRDLAAGITPHPELRMSVGPTPRAASPSAEPKRPPRRSKKQRAKTPAALRPPEPGKPDNLRKSYFRSLAENVGFQSTDPLVAVYYSNGRIADRTTAFLEIQSRRTTRSGTTSKAWNIMSYGSMIASRSLATLPRIWSASTHIAA